MGRTCLPFVALLNLVAHHVLVGFVFGCHDAERQALYKFKQSFSDPSQVLSAWNGTDCCLWDGVTCNNVTGSVNRLELSGMRLSALKLDSSLLELRDLNYLDLNGNDFQGSQIPGFISSLKRLTYLDLSGANFSAILPSQLGNLTRLQYLGLSGPIEDDYRWAPGVVNFEKDVLISNTRNMMQVLTNLPSLTYLQLTSCGLVNSPHFYALLSNSTWFSRIETLDLSFNWLAGPLSNGFGNMSSLVYLDLSGNLLTGTVPLWLRDIRTLEILHLSDNSFTHVEGGLIMGILDTFSPLKELLLDCNSLEGELGDPRGNFSGSITPDLVDLDLSNNKITGSLPSWLGELRSLEVFYIGSNRISGNIPTSIGNLSALSFLNLSNNSLDGVVPEGLGQLTNLVEMDLSSNYLEGVFSDSHLANLSNLESLSLSNNRLKLKFSDDWSPQFRLSDELSLSSCTIGAQLPNWIKSQTFVQELGLSNADISGESLYFLCEFRHLEFLDLHKNQFFGTIPDCLSLNNKNSLQLIDFSTNKLSGPIPQSIGRLMALNALYLNNNSLEGEFPQSFSSLSNLIIMDVGENYLSGSIPDLKSNSLRYLKYLRMRSNKFVGVIPEHLCALPSVQLLDLANNNLNGSIPLCFGHLRGMNLPSSVKTNSTLPPSLAIYANNLFTDDITKDENVIEVLKGEERQYTSSLNFLVNLDLSCNKLVGAIPDSITNLSGLVGLNLSHNHLTGGIPQKIGEMRSLESLDLSNNRLSGTIPSSLAAITSLSSLNLSNNQLSGHIPTGNQLQTLDNPSIYAGNKGLCGDPLPNKCGTTNSQQQQQQESDKENAREKILLYFVIFSGFATGFWGFVGSLILKRRFRFALFHVLSNITDYIYVQTMIWQLPCHSKDVSLRLDDHVRDEQEHEYEEIKAVHDCFLLDFNNPFETSLPVIEYSDDISILAEKGQVACRDYPH